MVRLIDRIREEQAVVEANREAEAIKAEQRRIEQEAIQRTNGRISAADRVAHIEQIILDKVKHDTYVYSEPVVDKVSGQFAPFWEAYSDYLIDHFTAEGLTVRLTKLPIYHASVIVAINYSLEFSWLHA